MKYSYILFLPACLCALLCLCACSSRQQVRVIGFSQCSEDDWRTAMNKEALQEASFHPGIELRIKSVKDDTQQQIKDVEQFIADRVDLIVLAPNEAEPLVQVVEDALAAGIPVVLADRKIASDNYSAFVGADNYQIGHDAGIYIAERLGGRGRVFEIQGLRSSTSAAERHMGFMEAIRAYPGIEVVPLKVKYPQGGEKQLIDAIIRRQVPAPPAIPINVGAVVQNVGTAFAVYEAIQKNKPLFERVVTVTGKSLAEPSNFLARMGTPMSQLIDAAGGLPEDTGKVVGGGPMMGKALATVDVPVCKGSSGILVINEKEAKRTAPQPCIRCAKCVSVCPMGLEPYLLATCSAHGDWERVEHEMIMSCIECGSCQFTCPSHRPMLDYIRLGKGKVGGIIRARNAKK